jgi:putative sigma-54 modulation protein
MNIQIRPNNFDLTEPFKQYIEEKFSVLEKYHENITSFQVSLSRNQKHQKGEVYTVEAILSLPHQSTIFVKENHSDAHAAVDLVQEKLTRQLTKAKDKKQSRWRNRARSLKKSLRFWRRDRE